MYPEPILEIGPFKVYLYGLMIAIGLIFCMLHVQWYSKSRKMEKGFADFVETVGIAAIITGFFTSVLFQSFYNYLENPEDGWQWGGMTFLGGLIGGVISFIAIYFIFGKKYRKLFINVLDLAPASIVIAHAFGRIGCFFAGCCYGKETNSWLGVHFPEIDGKVFPTQLFESAFLFCLFGVLVFLCLKKKFKYNMTVYLASYGVWRFLIEFIRGDDRGKFVGPFSPSQLISIGMILCSVPVFFLLKYLWKIRDAQILEETKELENTMVEPSLEGNELENVSKEN